MLRKFSVSGGDTMEIKIYEPKAEVISVTVSVPMHVQVSPLLMNEKDIDRCEKAFIRLRDQQTKSIEKKRDYDRCRATIKWAKACSASIEKVTACKQRDSYYVKFVFSFISMEAVNEFYEGLRENVRSATM